MSEEIKAAPAVNAPAAPAIDTDAIVAEVTKKATKAASKSDIKRSQLASALERLVEPTKREKREARNAEAEERGANSVLKDLGVKKSERARMLEEIKAGKVELAARKLEAEEARREAAEAKAAADKANPYVERARLDANRAYEELPESFQKALTELNIDDPLERLRMIDIFKKNGALSGQPADAKAATKTPKPATTLGSSGPPAPKSGPAMNYLEMYTTLKSSGQKVLAAQYWNRYGHLIEGLRGQ